MDRGSSHCIVRHQLYSDGIFTGKRPDLSHLLVFGSEVMVHVPKEKGLKLHAKSERGIFMGYSENSEDSYRVYNFETRNEAVNSD